MSKIMRFRPRNPAASVFVMPSDAKRTLVVAGTAHALHDGYTDLIYVLLPIWQAEFALSYGMLALLRGLYAGAMAALQLPAGRLAERLDGRLILALGTALSAVGYLLAGYSGGLFGLCVALVLSGAGSSAQHPIASAAVSRAYGAGSRGPLGTYNFAGDLGKAAIPALTSLLLTLMPWRHSLWLLALLGLAVALGVALLMPPIGRPAVNNTRSMTTGAMTTGAMTTGAKTAGAMTTGAKTTGAMTTGAKATGQGRGGFALLFAIGVLDTGVRMGLLTFLPFLLKSKGASLPTVGIALAMVFLGGAAGKFTCGWLGARVGVLRTVLVTEGGTAAAIFAVLLLPLIPSLVLLPLLGVMLNGTSSVLYGTVPELAPPDRTERAFALFYTGTIGSGAISPVLYGVLGDAVGADWAVAATAMVALAIFPFAFALAPHVAENGRP
jgi:FSR family fosmidomycin resistance protein-like MFS transporter